MIISHYYINLFSWNNKISFIRNIQRFIIISVINTEQRIMKVYTKFKLTFLQRILVILSQNITQHNCFAVASVPINDIDKREWFIILLSTNNNKSYIITLYYQYHFCWRHALHSYERKLFWQCMIKSCNCVLQVCLSLVPKE